MLARRADQSGADAAGITRHHLWYERALIDSMERFFPIPAETRTSAKTFLDNLARQVGQVGPIGPAAVAHGEGRLVFRRRAELKGTMSAFGYDYFDDHYRAEATPALMTYRGLRGSGGEYSYEVLNLADGRRTAQEIRDVVSATYGPIPLDLVVEYLKALESIRVIERVK